MSEIKLMQCLGRWKIKMYRFSTNKLGDTPYQIYQDGIDDETHSTGLNMDKFFTKDEMMDILRISSSSLTRYMNDGLPFIRVRGRVIFSKMEIEDYLKEHQVRLPQPQYHH